MNGSDGDQEVEVVLPVVQFDQPMQRVNRARGDDALSVEEATQRDETR